MIQSNTYIRFVIRITVMMAVITGLVSCEGFNTRREPDQVFIVYSLGFNNLATDLQQDIDELEASYTSIEGNNALVVFTHTRKPGYGYSTPNSPVIIELTKTRKGKVMRDTVLVMDKNTVAASGETLNQVLTFINNRHPESEYSILFSSHGTGWTPVDYCNEPDRYEDADGSSPTLMRIARKERKPYWGVAQEDGGPAVKSFGIQNITTDTYHEMNISEMADAFPMKMKSIIFDACFMGGIEVAYELRNVTDLIAASQTEILSDGMYYKTMLPKIYNGANGMKGICEDFFNYYSKKSGSEKSATISLIDCTKLDPLAEICKEIFDSQREEIAALEGSMSVQRYYRLEHQYNHRWFYDLEDIAIHSRVSQDQKDRLQAALEECIIYKAATERFMNDITIKTHCGLSMYLPYASHTYLNNFYKTLEWNKATGLVQ